MPESYGINGYNPTSGKAKGPKTYKAAKGPAGKGSYSGFGGKPKTDKRVNMVDKKVKKLSQKVMRFKAKNAEKAAFDRY